MAYRLRPAARDDLAALGELKLRASLAWDDHVEELQAMPEARVVPAEHLPFVFVVEDPDRIVGFGTVIPGSAGRADLEDLFVEPELWGLGIGRLLAQEAERRAGALGACALDVTAGRARAFYEACGFEVVGAAQTQLEPVVLMTLRLGRSA